MSNPSVVMVSDGGANNAAAKHDAADDFDTASCGSPNHSRHSATEDGGTPDCSKSANTSRRLCFRELVLKHATALTRAEKNFLYELYVTGNEIEVQVAHETLTNLFEGSVFDDTEGATSTENAADSTTLDPGYLGSGESMRMDESETSGWCSTVIQLGQERESDTSFRSADLDDDLDSSVFLDVLSSSSCRTLGSERRKTILLERKKSNVFDLWKAHETGLAVSHQASRRSVLVRRSQSVSRRDLFLMSANATSSTTAATDMIFRSLPEPGANNNNNNNSATKVHTTTKPVVRRRVSWTSGPPLPPSSNERAKMLWIQQQQFAYRQSLVEESRFTLSRMASESSRGKSVTFSKEVSSMPPRIPQANPLNQRATSLPTIPLDGNRRERASSVTSIPSLHLGAPIGSPGSTSRVSTVPSLHMARSIRSNSIRSDSCASDITESERYYENDEEKKSSWEAPSIVVGPEDGNSDDDPMVLEATKLLHTSDPDAPLLLENDADSFRPSVRPVLMRRASRNVYQGEGIELTDMDTNEAPSLMDYGTMKSSSSFDETMSSKRAVNSVFRRMIRRSYSDDSTGIFLGAPLDTSSRMFGQDLVSDDSSWNLGYDDDDDYFDSWKVLEDDYVNGYGGGDTLPFRIIGTSSHDVDAHPHVLSPPLMESLLAFLPSSMAGDNFWMKYSMVRDGASSHTFLQHARGARYSILAIETVEGEVFGAFTAEPWRKNWNYFGNGESFLWKMRESRKIKRHSIIDQAKMESEIDVFPYTGVNNCIQLCTSTKIAVGGGTNDASFNQSRKSDGMSFDSASHDECRDKFKDHEWGFGLTIESDFLHGTTSPCLTFDSPSLSSEHPSGSIFEIMNLELWTLTPCATLEDAEKLELGKLFLEKNTLQ